MASDVRSTQSPLAVARFGVAVSLAIVALALAGGAQADLGGASVDLGTVSIADGTVTLTGSVDDTGGQTEVHVNGQPSDVDANGGFTAVIDLEGDQKIVLTVTGQDETSTFTIPLSVLESEGP